MNWETRFTKPSWNLWVTSFMNRNRTIVSRCDSRKKEKFKMRKITNSSDSISKMYVQIGDRQETVPPHQYAECKSSVQQMRIWANQVWYPDQMNDFSPIRFDFPSEYLDIQSQIFSSNWMNKIFANHLPVLQTLESLENVYLNCTWTFPLSVVAVLESLENSDLNWTWKAFKSLENMYMNCNKWKMFLK